MSLARSFHLVQIALVPSVLLAACQPQPVSLPLPPQPAAVTPSAPPAVAPVVPVARDLTLRIVMPHGTYLRLHGMRTQGLVTEEEVAAGTLRGLVYVVNGRVLRPDEYTVLGAEWDEAGRIVVRVKLLSPPGGDARISVATPRGDIVLYGDAPESQQTGVVVLDLETTARALVRDSLKAKGLKDDKVPDSVIAGVVARLANLLATRDSRPLLEQPSLQTVLQRLVDAVTKGEDLSKLSQPGVLDPLAVGPGGGSSRQGTISLSSLDLVGGVWNVSTYTDDNGGGPTSPAFSWSTVPRAASYALIVEDKTVPRVQWVVYDLPAAVTSFGSGADIAGLGGLLGKNGDNLPDYNGFGTFGHQYRATLYALDVASLTVPAVPPDVLQVRAAMAGHVLAMGKLDGLAVGE